MPRDNYYDVDAILAEEALVPCTTLFDFSFLSHLDPDITASSAAATQGKQRRDQAQHYLRESSRINMPLWAVEKWALLGYVRLAVPKHYGQKLRERLEADASQVDLRKRNERFFLSGRRVIHLVEQHCAQVKDAIRRSSGTNSNRQLEELANLEKQATELRRTLVSTYTGTRLSHTLNWALSSVGDDVTAYTSKLTQLERRLFHSAAAAATHHATWKVQGQRRSRPKRPRAVAPDPLDAKRPRSQ
jgi:hypothetical protein